MVPKALWHHRNKCTLASLFGKGPKIGAEERFFNKLGVSVITKTLFLTERHLLWLLAGNQSS